MRELSPMLHWMASGIEYEADQRRADIIVAELGVGMRSTAVTTPGIPPQKGDSEEEEALLEGEQRSQYRGMVARANYLAQARCDIQFLR